MLSVTLNDIPIDHIVLSNLKIVGAAGCYGNATAVCGIMRKCPPDIDAIVTHHVPFSDCLNVFRHKEKYHKTKIKVMIDFD